MPKYPTPVMSPLDHERERREQQAAALRELQEPTGTSMTELARQVRENLATVDARIDSGVAARSYSKSDIDTRVANPPSVSTPGAIVSSASVTAPTGRFDSGLYSNDARNFIVAQNYAASWIDVNGHFGISPSSRRFKRDIEAWHPDVARFFEHVRAVRFHYDVPDQPYAFDPAGEPFYGPHPDPGLGPWQYGFIAEELVDAGLDMFTFQDADGLVLGINYDRVVVALFDVMRRQDERLSSIEQRLDALEG